MKKSATILVAVALVTAQWPLGYVSAKSFSDVPTTHPYLVAITHLSEAGLIKGYEDGTFQPEKIVNRAEALKLILESAGVQLEEKLEGGPFKDVSADQWFAKYVDQAKKLAIVNGNPDGTFTPAANVKRAAFLKMLLETNRFKKDKWADEQYFKDVGKKEWYAAYMNYAGKSGLLTADANGNLSPDKDLSRGEVAEILYLMKIILKGKDTQFLISQAEAQMAQIELYIGAKNIGAAKRSAELGNDMSQQALKNRPDDKIVLGAAKIAKAYQLLVDAYIAGIQKKNDQAKDLAEQAKTKATEAWEANNDIQSIAKHIKTRADEIIGQLK